MHWNQHQKWHFLIEKFSYLVLQDLARIYRFLVYFLAVWLALKHLLLFDTIHHDRQCLHLNLQSIESMRCVRVNEHTQNAAHFDRVHPKAYHKSRIQTSMQSMQIKTTTTTNEIYINEFIFRSRII